jgi:hypothetical protein
VRKEPQRARLTVDHSFKAGDETAARGAVGSQL